MNWQFWKRKTKEDAADAAPKSKVREWWDAVFKAGLEARGIGWFARNMMYAGVRLHGHRFFRTNRIKGV